MLAIARRPIHYYVYRAEAIDAVVRAQGLERRFSCVVDRWQVVIYVRSSPFTANASRNASSAGEERAQLVSFEEEATGMRTRGTTDDPPCQV